MKKILEKLKQQLHTIQTQKEDILNKIKTLEEKIKEIEAYAKNNKVKANTTLINRIKTTIGKTQPDISKYNRLITKHRRFINKILEHKIDHGYVEINIKGYTTAIIILLISLSIHIYYELILINSYLNPPPPIELEEGILNAMLLALGFSILLAFFSIYIGYIITGGLASWRGPTYRFAAKFLVNIVCWSMILLSILDLLAFLPHPDPETIIRAIIIVLLPIIVVSVLTFYAVKNMLFFTRLRSLPKMFFDLDVARSIIDSESFIKYMENIVSRSTGLDAGDLCSRLSRVPGDLYKFFSGLTELREYCKDYYALEKDDIETILKYVDTDRLNLFKRYSAELDRNEEKLRRVERARTFVEVFIGSVEADIGGNYGEAISGYNVIVEMLGNNDYVDAINSHNYISPLGIGGVVGAVSSLRLIIDADKALLQGDLPRITEIYRRLSEYADELLSIVRGGSVYLDLVLEKMAMIRERYGDSINKVATVLLTSSESPFIGKALKLKFKGISVQPFKKRFRIAGVEIRGIIGVGGYAATFLGVDEVGRSYVVKVPREVLESLSTGVTYYVSDSVIKAFGKELEVLRSLRHPHIIEVIDGGISEGTPYILIEFCEKGSLRGVLESQGKLSLRDTLVIGIQIADVLDYIHSKEIVHRDLKPENILFTREGILKVTDFNIVKIMRTVSPTTSRLSPYTPGYAAPEQIYRGYGKIGPWTDIWALGVIIYEMITGKPPFNRWDYEESIKEPPKLRDLPDKLARLVEKMLSEEPEKRPTAQEVKNTLLNILAETKQ